LLAGALRNILTLDSGLLHTVHRLTVGPGQVIRGFLAGRTVPYTHPATYLLISFAAFALGAGVFSNGTGNEGDRVFVALLAPCVAIAARLLFWRAGLNFAEHLIIALYVLGHVVLLYAGMLIAMPLALERALGYGAIALGIANVPWAYSRVFPSRAILAAAGGLVALAGGAVIWTVFMIKLLELLRR
jgi:hypothetical protein